MEGREGEVVVDLEVTAPERREVRDLWIVVDPGEIDAEESEGISIACR